MNLNLSTPVHVRSCVLEFCLQPANWNKAELNFVEAAAVAASLGIPVERLQEVRLVREDLPTWPPAREWLSACR